MYPVGRIRIRRIGETRQSLSRGYQALLTCIVGQKIVAVSAIRIACVHKVFVSIIPAIHALGVEQYIVAGIEYAIGTFVHIKRHRRQVVDMRKTKILIQRRPAVAVNTHIGGVESGSRQFVVGQAMHARFCHTDLHPLA